MPFSQGFVIFLFSTSSVHTFTCQTRSPWRDPDSFTFVFPVVSQCLEQSRSPASGCQGAWLNWAMAAKGHIRISFSTFNIPHLPAGAWEWAWRPGTWGAAQLNWKNAKARRELEHHLGSRFHFAAKKKETHSGRGYYLVWHAWYSEAGTKPHVTWLLAPASPPLSPGFSCLEGHTPLPLYWRIKFPGYEAPRHLREGEPAASLS